MKFIAYRYFLLILTALAATSCVTQVSEEEFSDGYFILSGTSVDFGNVKPGSSAAMEIWATNVSGGILSLSKVISGDNVFGVSGSGCDNVPEKGVCVMALIYVPPASGSYSATLTLSFGKASRRVFLYGESSLSGSGKEATKLYSANDYFKEELQGAAFSGDASRLLAYSSKEIKAWDIKGGKKIFSLKLPEVGDAVFSPDGKRVLAAAGEGGYFGEVYDISSGKALYRLPTGKDKGSFAFYSDDGSLIFLGTKDGKVYIFDASSGALKTTREVAPLPEDIYGMDYKTHTLAAVGKGNIYILNILKSIYMGFIPIDIGGPYSRISSFALSPGGGKAAFLSGNNLEIWDLASHSKIKSFVIPSPGILSSLAFAGEDKIALAGSKGYAALFNIATETEERVFDLKTSSAIKDLVFSKDGFKGASVHDTGDGVRLFNSQGGVEKIFIGHRGPLTSVYCSNDKILTAGSDGKIMIWNPADGSFQNILIGHKAIVEKAIFSPDGKTVVSAGQDKGLLWDAGTGSPIKELTAAGKDLKGAAFSKDGSHFVTWNGNGEALLWNKAGDPLFRFSDLGRNGTNMEFSFDGSRLLVSDYSKGVSVFDTASYSKIFSVSLNKGGAASFIDGGNDMIIFNSARAEISLYDPAGLLKKSYKISFVSPPLIHYSAFIEGGMSLALQNGKNMEIYDCVSGNPKLIISLEKDDIVRSLSLSPSGKYLAMLRGNGDYYEIWSLK